MATKPSKSVGKIRVDPEINAITVRGYKSIASEQTIELRNLTILAGANSSGKSSMLQPLLLLKQTLDAPYDPGALLLNGANVRLTAADQLLSKLGAHSHAIYFSIGFHAGAESSTKLQFNRIARKGMELEQIVVQRGTKRTTLNKNTASPDIEELVTTEDMHISSFLASIKKTMKSKFEWHVERDRCFFNIRLGHGERMVFGTSTPGVQAIKRLVQDLIHVPGLRGNPERSYPTTEVGSRFPGTFEHYVASVISHWEESKSKHLETLGDHLERLGLTWKVKAQRVDDTQVELKVGRLTKSRVGGQHDLVNIADVGFGMSQVLPVVVALLTAKKGQVVYLEQPEIHLHPKAQWEMATIIVEASARGVNVIVETHSALLLLGIQTLVAKGKIARDHVKLHWFKRSTIGETEVSSGNIDESGAFGPWPEDFGEVVLKAQREYLDAAEQALLPM